MFKKYSFEEVSKDMYVREDEEVSMEVVKVGKKYVVRIEECCRFDRKISRLIVSKDEVEELIKEVFWLDFEEEEEDF